MKKIVTLASLLVSIASFAQATFNAPESVEFDAANNRWLVGNNGAGAVVSYYPASNLTVPFCSGMTTGPHGIEIMGNTAYVCDGGYIRGYALSNGANTFNLNLGATFLNGLTTDGSTYLFATDFSAKKIYRVNPAANAFNLMCTTAKTPNGIIYDGANNRCVFVTWGTNAPVQAMSLADSTVSTLLATTLSNCDGITRDNAGYWYVTTWGGNALRRIDPAFSAAPVSVMTGLSSPADIDINTNGDSIGIPNNGSLNNVVFYTSITTGIAAPAGPASLHVYPNPSSGTMNIVLPEHFSSGTYELVTIFGDVVAKKEFVGASFQVDLSAYAAGTAYLLRVTDAENRFTYTQQVVAGE